MENERLQAEVTRLKRLVVSGATSVLSDRKFPSENEDSSSKLNALEMELQLAKEALLSMYMIETVYMYLLNIFYNFFLKDVFESNLMQSIHYLGW